MSLIVTWNFEAHGFFNNVRRNSKMVFLTMTTSMVEALEKIRGPEPAEEKDDKLHEEGSKADGVEEPIAPSKQVEEKNPLSKEEVSRSPMGNAEKASTKTEEKGFTEPSLKDPKVGNPISHGQVIDLSRQLKAQGLSPCRLETLLKGAKVYVPPPPPKKEPVSNHYFIHP